MIEDRDAYDELLEKHKDDNMFLVFKFGSEWCGSCKRIDPHYKEYKELSLERGVSVEFHYLDIDEESIMDLMSDDLDLKLVPHFLIVRNGEVVSTLQTSQKDSLFEFLDTYLI